MADKFRPTSIFFWELYEKDEGKEGTETKIIFEAKGDNLLTLAAFEEMIKFEEEVLRGDIWLNNTQVVPFEE